MVSVISRILETAVMFLSGIYFGFIQDFNVLELLLAGVVFWLAARGALPALAVVGRFEALLLRFRRRRWLPLLSFAVAAIALRLLLLPVLPAPKPVVTDEFSHLLLADTLLHGRLANPTHPFWMHFESLHIIQRPSYVSNYFPGHAMVLAAAIWLTGNPWVGVLALSGAFSAALFWMLRGWFTTRWAAFGTLLAILRFGLASYWINGHHGGFLAAIGGALIAGAYPRLRQKVRLKYSLLFGCGCCLLLLTRPFEGAFFAGATLVCLLAERRIRPCLHNLMKLAAPIILLVAITAAGLGFYFSRVTGSPFVTAYAISQQTYGWPMALAWVSPKPVVLRHVELQRYYDYELAEHEKVDGPAHFLGYSTLRVEEYWRFYLGPFLSLTLLGFPGVWRTPRYCPLIFGAGAALLAVSLEGASSPHYLAPAAACLVALIVACCRELCLRPKYHIHMGIFLRRAAPLVMLLVLGLRITAQTAGLPYTQFVNYQSWCCKVQGNYNKARITSLLQQTPGTHLVFVKTKLDEMNLFQWVYNGADIDGAKIVWARDLGPEQNEKLRSYFANRRIWVVDPNLEPSTVTQYPEKWAPVPLRTAAR